MLSNTEINEEIKNNEIVIQYFEENCLQGASYDLRIGNNAYQLPNGKEINIEEGLVIHPSETYLIESFESLELSGSIAATIHSTVSEAASKSLSNISTTIDPNWKGTLLIQVHNYGKFDLLLKHKEKFATVCFYKLNKETDKNCRHQIDRNDIKLRFDRKLSFWKKVTSPDKLSYYSLLIAIISLIFTYFKK